MSEGKPRLQILYDACGLAQEVTTQHTQMIFAGRASVFYWHNLSDGMAQPSQKHLFAIEIRSWQSDSIKHFGKVSALIEVDSTHCRLWQVDFVLILQRWQ